MLRRKKIAVLVASIDREYQHDFAAGLASAGLKYGMDICIFNSQGHMNVSISMSEVGESMIYNLPDLRDFDGIISMPATMGNDFALQKLNDILKPLKGKPHVSIDIPRDDAVTIQFDDRISVEEITEHLITEHGVKRIAFISGPFESSVAMERVEACRKVLKRHGLELKDHMLFDGQWTRTGGKNAAEKIINMGGELPDALMCGNDDMALSVIECLNEHGINVPDDIAVTGFDALREAVTRGVTTICRPIDRSARKAIEILNKWIEEGEMPKEKNVLLSTIPIYGNSCGCEQTFEHISDKLRTLGNERWDMETILTRVSMYSGNMRGAGNEDEAYMQIRDFVNSWNISEMYLLVNPAVCREYESAGIDGNSYPSEMLLLFGIREGKEYERQLFPVSRLSPVLEEVRKKASCLVFCPLYYRDKSLGYVVMNHGEGTGKALYPVLMLLNGTLISLYLQTSLKRSASTIQRMASHDIMTGLLNRRGYMELAPSALEQARRDERLFALISADMDHMKDINDKYGHLKGDEAICRMGMALQCLLQFDFTPVHISGDEFLAYGITDSLEDAIRMTDEIKQEIARMNREEPWICDISASIGLYAAVPSENDSIDGFMTMADHSMYAEKNKKKYGRRKDDIHPE